MAYAIELYFDPDSEAILFELFAAIARAGYSQELLDMKARPHVSLTTLQTTKPEELGPGLADFAKTTAPFSLQFSSLGVFPTAEGVVFLAPVVTQRLLKVQIRLHHWLATKAVVPGAYYLPGQWVPHCTVAIRLPAPSISPVVSLVKETTAVFREVQVTAVGLIGFPPVTEYFVFPLSEQGEG